VATLEDLQKIPNAAQPTPGQGLTLDINGLIPPTTLAPTPTDLKFLQYNDTTKQGQWATVSVPLVVPPTYLPGMAVTSANGALTANQAYLIPIPNVITTTTLTRLTYTVATDSGNMDLGIFYSDDEATFTRLFSTGSFTVPAAGNKTTTIAQQTITPVAGRRWYYGFAADNATAFFGVQWDGGARAGVPGYFKITSFPLPSSLTSMTAFGASTVPVLHGAV
jgi:hypothetical protein